MTIECPSVCPYLIASRSYDLERRKPDWSKMPFAEVKVPRSVEATQARLLDMLTYTISEFAGEHRLAVDTDVLAPLQALAETYRTLSSGLYYEKPIDHRLQRELCEKLKAAIEDYKRESAQQMAPRPVKDSDIRDALIMLAQIGFGHLNGRPKGRAFIDLLRGQFRPEDLAKPKSNLLVLP